MRLSRHVILAVLLGILAGLATDEYLTSLEPDTITFDPPKQLHHVIYVSMCGVLEGIILTTDPVQFADYKTPMTPEMIELEKEALNAGRFHSFVAGLWVMCGEPFPKGMDVIEGIE